MCDRDPQGVARGRCTAEGCACPQFTCSKYARCDYCDHVAVAHVGLDQGFTVTGKGEASNGEASALAPGPEMYQQYPSSQSLTEGQNSFMPSINGGYGVPSGNFVPMVPALLLDPADLEDPVIIRSLGNHQKVFKALGWIFSILGLIVFLTGIFLLIWLDPVVSLLAISLPGFIYLMIGVPFIIISMRNTNLNMTFSRSARKLTYQPPYYGIRFGTPAVVEVNYEDVAEFYTEDSCYQVNHRSIIYIHMRLVNGQDVIVGASMEATSGVNPCPAERMNRLIKLR